MGFFSSAESGAGPLSCNPPSPHQTSRGYWMQWSSISSRDSSEGGRLEKCSSLPSQLRRRSPRYLSLGQGKLRQVTSKLGTFLPQESPAHLWNIGTTPASPALQSGWRSVESGRTRSEPREPNPALPYHAPVFPPLNASHGAHHARVLKCKNWFPWSPLGCMHSLAPEYKAN